jgi:hypothetical protein
LPGAAQVHHDQPLIRGARGRQRLRGAADPGGEGGVGQPHLLAFAQQQHAQAARGHQPDAQPRLGLLRAGEAPRGPARLHLLAAQRLQQGPAAGEVGRAQGQAPERLDLQALRGQAHPLHLALGVAQHQALEQVVHVLGRRAERDGGIGLQVARALDLDQAGVGQGDGAHRQLGGGRGGGGGALAHPGGSFGGPAAAESWAPGGLLATAWDASRREVDRPLSGAAGARRWRTRL